MDELFRLEAPYRGPYSLRRLTFGSGAPTTAVVAGLHGNELNGVHALNLICSTLRLMRLSGTVHLFPVVNSFGLEHGTKRWPFGDQDINRAFPGDPEGSPVQRIRYADNECNYCAVCQCGGKLLADRGLSTLLKRDWPRTLAELEELRRPDP